MHTCHVCGARDLFVLLDYGPQPICNRFLKTAREKERRFPLALAQCKKCGLLQLPSAPPASELRPRYEWITYSEPERHLDAAVDEIIAHTRLHCDARIIGVSFKDASTLERLRRKGFHDCRQIDPSADLGITSACASIETLQSKLTKERAQALAAKHGRADLVVARHIIEHAHSPLKFMEALKALVKPGSHVAVEVPDFTVSLEHFDYSTIWEEHILYFTASTFRNSLGLLGFRILHFMNYPYPIENSLMAVAQLQHTSASMPDDSLREALDKAGTYAVSQPAVQRRIENMLAGYRRTGGRIALFGAGHLACTFINLLKLKDHIEFIADDHPHKKGMYMPGSKLPIRGSSTLAESHVRLCLLSLNPESEEKVMNKHRDYARNGGTYASIFPSSPRSLDIVMRDKLK